jgi:hypothetical protein
MELKGIIYDVGRDPARGFRRARKSWRQWMDRRRRVAAGRGITYLASDLAQETCSDFAVPFNGRSRG